MHRPQKIATVQDAQTDILIAEAERFIAFLEGADIKSGQRDAFCIVRNRIIENLRQFSQDILLVIGDTKEITRRVADSNQPKKS